MSVQTVKNEFSTLVASDIIPLFEIELKNGEYLFVELSQKRNSIFFNFDENGMTTYFDGCIKKEGGVYRMAIDGYFTLTDHLEKIYANIVEGFIIPNNLMVE